jgi:predicted nucleic acid-binding protein
MPGNPAPYSHLRSLDDSPLPEVIYFDTSFLCRVFVKNVPYHNEAVNFIHRLETAPKQPVVVMSQILRSELWNGLTNTLINQMFRAKKKGRSRVNVDEKLQNDPRLIDQIYPDVVRIDQDLKDLMQRFKEWWLQDLNQDIIDSALLKMKAHRLRSSDAIHIATMEYWNITDIAAFDWAIEEIATLNVWTHKGTQRLKDRLKMRQKYLVKFGKTGMTP